MKYMCPLLISHFLFITNLIPVLFYHFTLVYFSLPVIFPHLNFSPSPKFYIIIFFIILPLFLPLKTISAFPLHCYYFSHDRQLLVNCGRQRGFIFQQRKSNLFAVRNNNRKRGLSYKLAELHKGPFYSCFKCLDL